MIAGAVCDFRFRNCLHIRFQIRLGAKQIGNTTTADAVDQNAQGLPLGLQDLLDLCNSTDRIQLLQSRIIHKDILLGNEKNILPVLHCLLQGLDGFHAAHIKVDRLTRKNRKSTQCQYRKLSGNDLLAHWGHLLSI